MGLTLNSIAAPKSLWPRRLAMLFLLLLIGGGIAGYYEYRKHRPTLVHVAQVTRRDVIESVVANGRVQPVVQVKISPEVSGEIIELPVKEGQRVKKGDLLLRIRPDNYIASRRSAEASYKASVASLAQSAASLEKTEIEYKRHQLLSRDHLISETVWVEVQTARDVAKASHDAFRHQVDVAKAALARAEEELNKTTITSPIDGTVSRLNSQLGERVVGTAMMTGTEVMVVADLSVMEARVEVGEMDVVLMQIGLPASLDVDAFRDRKFKGGITEVANSSKNAGGLSANGGSGSGAGSQEATRFEIRIRIEDKEYFRPGMSVTAQIETRRRTNVLTIPIPCVTTRVLTNSPSLTSPTPASGSSKSSEGMAESSRERVRPTEVVFLRDGGVVHARAVKRGISDDMFVEITEGIGEREEVVSASARAISRDLMEGSKIQVTEEPLKAESTATP